MAMPMMTDQRIQVDKNFEAFQAPLPTILPLHHGKYALMKGQQGDMAFIRGNAAIFPMVAALHQRRQRHLARNRADNLRLRAEICERAQPVVLAARRRDDDDAGGFRRAGR